MKYHQFTSKTEPALNDPLWLICCKTKNKLNYALYLIYVCIIMVQVFNVFYHNLVEILHCSEGFFFFLSKSNIAKII